MASLNRFRCWVARALIALLFPGQGAQQVGMGQGDGGGVPHRAARPSRRRTIVLGYDLARICFEGPHDELMSHRALPAGRADELGGRLARRPRARRRAATSTDGPLAGRVLGPGGLRSLSFEQALSLVQTRGAAATDVAAATPGSMVALLGASDEDVEALCLEAGDVWPATTTAPGRSWRRACTAGDRLLDLARARGIKAGFSTWTGHSTRR